MQKSNNDEKEIWKGIVLRIKELRHKQGLSVHDLAKKAGFTKGYVSHIENLRREPTVGSLLKISSALGVSISFLFEGVESNEQEDSIVISKRKDRRRIKAPSSSGGEIYDSINHRMKNRLMEAYIVTPGYNFPKEPEIHEGQELIFMLEGTDELIYDGKSQILEKGDCCYFDSSKPHSSRSIGDEPSKVLVVFTSKEK